MDQINLRDFLLKKTRNRELCVITEDGWIVACAFIDHEDLFLSSIPERLKSMPVKRDQWALLPLYSPDRVDQAPMVHYIDV